MNDKVQYLKEVVSDKLSEANNGADRAYLDRVKNVLNISDQIAPNNDQEITAIVDAKMKLVEEERKSIEAAFTKTIENFSKKSEEEKELMKNKNSNIFNSR